jgi:signal transduction histidine kinase
MESMQRVEKMATIGELAAAVAHEIKNPLAGISGAIQVLAEDFSPDDPRKGIIKEVLGEIERLDKAVRDLLSFAKPPEPNFVKTPITPVIERSLRLVRAQARRHGVKINIIAAGDTADLRVDPEQMQQVFLNMMMNAIHSMPGGGALTVSTSLRADGSGVEVSIADTGAGIRSEELKNIFKPFFTTKHTGTGLGLAISKNIVEKHGGNIIVDSQVGVGSNFRVILPVAGKTEQEPENA